MALTPVQFLRSYNASLVAKLVSAGGTGTPEPDGYVCSGANGLQSFLVPEPLVGWFYVYAVDVDEIAYHGYVKLADTVHVHRCREELIEVDGHTDEETLRLLLAAMRGNVAGAGTDIETIMAADGSKPRIVATVDSFGNRTITTSDAT